MLSCLFVTDNNTWAYLCLKRAVNVGYVKKKKSADTVPLKTDQFVDILLQKDANLQH